jgi:hypothetical protein
MEKKKIHSPPLAFRDPRIYLMKNSRFRIFPDFPRLSERLPSCDRQVSAVCGFIRRRRTPVTTRTKEKDTSYSQLITMSKNEEKTYYDTEGKELDARFHITQDHLSDQDLRKLDVASLNPLSPEVSFIFFFFPFLLFLGTFSKKWESIFGWSTRI